MTLSALPDRLDRSVDDIIRRVDTLARPPREFRSANNEFSLESNYSESTSTPFVIYWYPDGRCELLGICTAQSGGAGETKILDLPDPRMAPEYNTPGIPIRTDGVVVDSARFAQVTSTGSLLTTATIAQTGQTLDIAIWWRSKRSLGDWR